MHACWARFLDADPAWRDAVLTALSDAGIDVQPEPAAESQPALLFFDGAATALGPRIAEMSRGGSQRVAVIARHQAALRHDTWRLLHAGASDLFGWDHSDHPAAEIASRLDRWQEVDRLVEGPTVRDNLVGQCPAWLRALRRAVEIARFSSAPALLLGESGTGKELAARLIHTLDRRTDKGELVVLDCTTVVPELAGSEFFGHERGAFTGAVAAHEGAFAVADRGTLFLDEVGELSLDLQARLLRVIQHGTYKRVGSNQWRRTRFRLVSATNRDLWRDVRRGRFRSDLYHRLATHPVRMPALRDRAADIPRLVAHFMTQHGCDTAPEVDEPVRRWLLTRPYPGNVRDLEQLVGRIMLRHVGPGPITAGDLPPDEWPRTDDDAPGRGIDGALEGAIRAAMARGAGLKELGRAAEDVAVRIALEDHDGHLPRAAKALGVTGRALQLRRAAQRKAES